MKLPFEIHLRQHGYDFLIMPIGFDEKTLAEEIVDGLMDIEIEYVESHNCYMGGSPFSFFVERMKEPQAEHFRDIIQYFFESHKLNVYIEYNHKYDSRYG